MSSLYFYYFTAFHVLTWPKKLHYFNSCFQEYFKINTIKVNDNVSFQSSQSFIQIKHYPLYLLHYRCSTKSISEAADCNFTTAGELLVRKVFIIYDTSVKFEISLTYHLGFNVLNDASKHAQDEMWEEKPPIVG